MNPGLDSLDEIVRQLWPRYKASVQPMWDIRLHRYSIEDLRAALWRHRADFPDETKPIWRTIYGILAGGDTSTGKSDLRILLDQMRRTIRSDPAWMKVKPIDAWSDSDLFENHIEAQVRPILRDINGKANDDPDGRLVRLAERTRTSFVGPYIRDLTERGERIPEWLVR